MVPSAICLQGKLLTARKQAKKNDNALPYVDPPYPISDAAHLRTFFECVALHTLHLPSCRENMKKMTDVLQRASRALYLLSVRAALEMNWC